MSGVVRSTAYSLNRLVPSFGSHEARLRVGRGIGSGKGKQCGRGGKGQTARSGRSKPRIGFEGGQTPLYKRVGKFGFDNPTRLEFIPINLAQIQVAIRRGRIPADATITQKTLADAGLISPNTQWPGVKLLASGYEWFDSKVSIEVPRASPAAIDAVERAGGAVNVQYAAKAAMRQLMQGEEVRVLGTPVPRLQQYYPQFASSASESKSTSA